MKRLGSTAVSPDGKWLGYSVTIVNLEQNTRTPELWLQQIAGGEPVKVAVAQPGDSGIEFAPDGLSLVSFASRAGKVRVWDPRDGSLRQTVTYPDAGYWRIIHPGSDIIRRMWLRAIRRRCLVPGA